MGVGSQPGNNHPRRGFDLRRIRQEREAEERRRKKEFSRDIGGRALNLMSILGTERREYHFEDESGGNFVPDFYSLGMTTYSNIEKFKDGSSAGLSITRRAISEFLLTGGSRLMVARMMPRAVGPIDEVAINYTNADRGGTLTRHLTRDRYSRIRFVMLGAPLSVDLGAQADIASFVEKLEEIESKLS